MSSSFRNKLRQWNQRPANLAAWIVASLSGAVSIALLVANLGGGQSGDGHPSPPATFDQVALAAAELADPRIGEVETRFRCPCGGCGVMELTECQCGMARGAMEVKGVIVRHLKAGHSVEETTRHIAETFGGLKPS